MATSSKKKQQQKQKEQKQYLQWSKKQSGVIIAYFILFYVFDALCIIYKPEAKDGLIRLALYVMIVMVANLGFYNGNSVLEKINGNKLISKATGGIVKEDKDDKDEQDEQDEKESGDEEEESGNG